MFGFKLSKPLLFVSILANFLMLAAPIHMLQVYDRVLVSGSTSTLFYVTLIAALALALFGMCETIRGRLAQRVSADFVVSNAEPMFRAAGGGRADQKSANEALRNFNTVRMFLSSKPYTSLYDLPFAPVFLVLIFFIHWQVGLLTALGIVALAFVAYLNRTISASYQEKATQLNSEAMSLASNIFSRQEDIRAMGLFEPLIQRWGQGMAGSINAQDSASAATNRFHGISRAVRQILQISIMAWGAYLVLNNQMSGGLIFAASMISGRALQPIEQLIGSWENISRVRTAKCELDGFLAKSRQQANTITQPEPKGVLRVDEVSLSRGDHVILNKVSFQLEAGEFLGIVGPSGAGKSTLARLICGAIDPSEGSIELDGCNQTNWSAHQWGQYVGYVGQELHLFPGTIAENIARMTNNPDDSRVISAAQATGVHELINAMPDGYMTRIGDGNIRLSGGQVQRLALARAIYTSPKLLILDEPNAHLDPRGEELLYAVLKNLKAKGVTIVTVSQRGRLNELADRVMVIKNGKIAAIHANDSAAGQFAKNKQVRASNTGSSGSQNDQHAAPNHIRYKIEKPARKPVGAI